MGPTPIAVEPVGFLGAVLADGPVLLDDDEMAARVAGESTFPAPDSGPTTWPDSVFGPLGVDAESVMPGDNVSDKVMPAATFLKAKKAFVAVPKR